MRIALIGCEYTGTTTLGNAIFDWSLDALGRRMMLHDHWKMPHISGHPPHETNLTLLTEEAIPAENIVAADAGIPEGESRIRHWKLDRVESATALDKWFSLPTNLDLGSQSGLFPSEEHETYTIQLSEPAAQRIREDPWHPDQDLAKSPEGDWLLRVDASHPLEILPRLLALGREARLLSPASACEEVRRIVDELSDAYAEEAGEA